MSSLASNNTYQDGAERYTECVAKIRALKTLRENTKEHGNDIARTVSELRILFRHIFLEQRTFCQNCGKDIESVFWRACFYDQITEYRKSIRKTMQLIDSIGVQSRSHIDKANAHLIQLHASFKKFLGDSSAFIHDLVNSLQQIGRSGDQSEKLQIAQCVHKLVIFLGDLARYNEMYAENGKTPDYSTSERLYERAAFMKPSSGNPHNQLAVLATYMKADCLAAYHYCRSILVQCPFESSVDNLRILFEKNEAQYHALSKDLRTSIFDGPITSLSDRENTKRLLASNVKNFLVRFIGLQGELFKWTRSCQSFTWHNGPSDSSRQQPEALNAEASLEVIHRMMEDLDQILTASVVGEQLLVRILVIAIFGVHFSAGARLPRKEDGDSKASKESSQHTDFFENVAVTAVMEVATSPHLHTQSESLALTVVFSLVTRVAARIRRIIAEDERNKKPVVKLLPLLSVFAEWCSYYREYLSSSPAIEQSISCTHPWLLATSEMTRSESRARSSMRAAFGHLREFFASTVGSDASAQPETRIMKEHVELRGFLPLVDQCELYCHGLSAFDKMPAVLPDELSRQRRQRILHAFLRDLIIPIAARDAAEAARRSERRIPLRFGQTTKDVEGDEIKRRKSRPPGKQDRENSRKRAVKDSGDAPVRGKKDGRNKADSRRKGQPADQPRESLWRNPTESQQEEFPELPWKSRTSASQAKRDATNAAWGNRGYASSLMYSSSAPTTSNPFEEDERKMDYVAQAQDGDEPGNYSTPDEDGSDSDNDSDYDGEYEEDCVPMDTSLDVPAAAYNSNEYYSAVDDDEDFDVSDLVKLPALIETLEHSREDTCIGSTKYQEPGHQQSNSSSGMLLGQSESGLGSSIFGFALGGGLSADALLGSLSGFGGGEQVISTGSPFLDRIGSKFAPHFSLSPSDQISSYPITSPSYPTNPLPISPLVASSIGGSNFVQSSSMSTSTEQPKPSVGNIAGADDDDDDLDVVVYRPAFSRVVTNGTAPARPLSGFSATPGDIDADMDLAPPPGFS